MAKYLGIPLTVSNGNKIPLTAQPELVTNGDFSNGTTDWSGTNATITVVGGELEVTSTSGFGKSEQNVTTVPGKAYTVSAKVAAGTVPGRLELFSSPNILQSGSVGETIGSGSKTILLRFVATSTTTTIQLKCQSASLGTAYFDDVTLKEIAATETPTYGSPEFVTNGDFSDGANDWIETGGWTFTNNKANRASFATNSYIGQDISVEIGRKYEVSYTRTYISGDGVTNLFSNFFDADPTERVTLGSYTGTVTETVTVKAVWVSTYSGTLSFRLYRS